MLGESIFGAGHLLMGAWDGCEEQQVQMDLHRAAMGAATSLWDLMIPPGTLWLAGFRAGLTSVPSHLPLSPSLGLLPRSSTAYLCFP